MTASKSEHVWADPNSIGLIVRKSLDTSFIVQIDSSGVVGVDNTLLHVYNLSKLYRMSSVTRLTNIVVQTIS